MAVKRPGHPYGRRGPPWHLETTTRSAPKPIGRAVKLSGPLHAAPAYAHTKRWIYPDGLLSLFQAQPHLTTGKRTHRSIYPLTKPPNSKPIGRCHRAPTGEPSQRESANMITPLSASPKTNNPRLPGDIATERPSAWATSSPRKLLLDIRVTQRPCGAQNNK